MSNPLIEMSIDDLTLEVRAFTALVNSKTLEELCEGCGDEAIARLDLYVQLLEIKVHEEAENTALMERLFDSDDV